MVITRRFVLQTLAMLFKKKRHLLNSHILHLTFSLVGTLDSGRETSSIPHKAAFENLLCDLEVNAHLLLISIVSRPTRILRCRRWLYISLSKMKFLNNVSAFPVHVLRCCISQAMRSASVKKLFYYYGVYTGCCVSFNTVFSKLKCALVLKQLLTLFSQLYLVFSV